MAKFKEVVKTTNTKNPKSPSSSIFDRFKGIVEEKEKLKNLIVKNNENVEKLKEVFKKYLKWCGSYLWSPLPSEEYKKALKLIKEKGINCTSEDIERFSLELIAFEDHEEFETRAGLFLSALINSSGDKEFVIHTSHLKKKIGCFSFDSKKKIEDDGYVEGEIGYHIERGIIISRRQEEQAITTKYHKSK
jgi:hypothetical protein